MFNLDSNSIDFTQQIDPKNPYKLPSFVFTYLNSIKSNLNSDNLFLCDVLIDYSWEMLNTNLWCFVDKIWRLIYGYSMLYKVIISKTENKTDSLIKLCDLGLLMSGPLLEKQFNQIISNISKETQQPDEEYSVKAKVQKLETINDPILEDKFKIKIEQSPSFETFKKLYFDKNVPVLIDGQMKHWPAVKKWR